MRDETVPASRLAPEHGPLDASRDRFFGDASETETFPDPVLAPVVPASATRPSVETLRGLAGGGLLHGAVSYLRSFGQSADASRSEGASLAEARIAQHSGFGWEEDDADLSVTEAARQAKTAAVEPPNVDRLLDTIVAAHVPGRGVQVVGTPVGGTAGPNVLIEVGRKLSVKGRAIIVDLNRLADGLAPLADARDGAGKIAAKQGLAELLAGDATFAEVIHRDQASRLHFIPSGMQEADFRDFDLILDALSETYDFIILLTPDAASSEIAKIMAPYAEFVVLAAATSDHAAVAEVESELLRAGAREVLVAGAPARRSLEVA